jgi:hypothetical protein
VQVGDSAPPGTGDDLRGGSVDRATDELHEAGFYENMHYETTPVRVGKERAPGIRAANDDREVLGEIARQLVIAGIPFRLVTVR